MAYAAVSSVLRTLERLLPGLCMVLRVQKLYIRMFKEKVCQLTSASNYGSRRKYLTEVFHELKRIECGNLQFLAKSTASDTLKEITDKLLFDTYQRKPEMVEKVEERFEEITEILEVFPGILEEIHLVEEELKKFSEKIHAEGLFQLFPGSSTSSQHFDMMYHLSFLFPASNRITSRMVFLHEEAVKIKNLCNDLSFFLVFLKDSANLCKNHEVVKSIEKCISQMANSVGDFLEKELFAVESMLNSSMVEGFEISGIREINYPKLDGIPGILIKSSIFPHLEGIETIKANVKTIKGGTLCCRSFQSESISTKVYRHTLIEEDIVVGLSDKSNEIVDRLTRQQSRLEIVAIVGMGGIGKTTLARKVFDHPFTVYHFHCRAWVTVSQVYQLKDLLLNILLTLTQPTNDIYEKSKEQLAECLYRSLKGRRYLIVFDDIWSIKAWNDVKRSFPDDRNGSRLLLTSRLKSVAVSANPRSPPFCMTLLTIDESWKLLEQKVFGKESCPVELMNVGKQIVKKCQGLPLAIAVVAGHLSQNKKTYECWKYVAENVNALVVTEPEQCQEIFALSYNFLPHHLKACFLYMGAFPEDCEIEVEKLIKLWVAEGFLDSNSSKSLEEVGEDILEELTDRSLVLVGKRRFSGKIKTCQLHDLLRELCLREAQNVKFMDVIKRDSQGFPLSLHQECRLSFHFNFYGDVHLLPTIPLMRSFLCFSVGPHFSPDIFFLRLRFMLLRVLDMGFLRFDHFPSQILKLVLLRYLALTATYDIPASISQLGNLQTLIIHGPWIPMQHGERPPLSLAYWFLPRLRHLQISVASCLRVPSIDNKNIGYPSMAPECLQTLSKIRFASCIKEVFSVMPHLKKLVVCETREDYISLQSFKCFHNFVFLQQLETLKCSFYAQNRIMRRMDWTARLPSTLKQLTFSCSNLPWTDLSVIAMLPKLEVLKLKNYAFRGPEWSPTEHKFCRLKHLLIEKTDLKHWNACNIHFPNLQHVVFRSCELLEEIPFDIGTIPTLELIELCYCSKFAEASAEEIKEQIEGLDVRIQSKWHSTL